MSRAAAHALVAPGLGLCLLLGACSTRLRADPGVPPPVRGHVVAAPERSVWDGTLRALARLGFTPEDADRRGGLVATGFKELAGNSVRRRTRGVARLAVERDLYRRGRARLVVRVWPKGPARTRVEVAALVEGSVKRRGEIRYSRKRGWQSPLPLFTAWTTAPAEVDAKGWEALTSNGVLEDEFLAALLSELSHDAVAPRPGRGRKFPRSPRVGGG